MNTSALPTSQPPWRVSRLLSAPHRLGFALGAAAMSLLFTFGFMLAFMAGFLFAAGPRIDGRPG